jgi:glycosyltransferase involved in cell wall biosynthesis
MESQLTYRAPIGPELRSSLHASYEQKIPMLRGRDILCFSHDWTGDPLSKTHIMRLLARENRVLWINSIGYRTPSVASKSDLGRAFKKLKAATTPIREVEKNIFVFNPIAMPLYGKIAQVMNQRLLQFQVRKAMRKLRFKRPLNWVFNPAAAVIAGKLGEEQLIYYCVDEYSAFSGVSVERMSALEEILLRRADLVIVSADKLFASRARVNHNTILVRHGVDYDHFRKALDPATAVPGEIANLPRPVIGFFGLIADWVDVELMCHTAKHFSSGSLVLLGKETTDVSELRKLPNVHLFGRKPYEQLPNYAKGFDVALNPFRINTLTLNANPLKVREYLAAGLPVVATPIPEVEVLGQCHIAGTPERFVREIELALEDPGPSLARSLIIRNESWQSRLEEICQHIGEQELKA